MKHDLASLKAALTAVPAKPVKAKLVRLVPFLDLVKYSPTDWLCTSGRPNRYNPAGVNCVYFGEDQAVGQAEFASRFEGIRGGDQPVTIYTAEVRLRRVQTLLTPRMHSCRSYTGSFRQPH